MKTAQYEGDLHVLAKWAVDRDTGEPPEPYRSWVKALLPPGHIGYFAGMVTPSTPTVDGWAQGYPHAHVISVGWKDPCQISAITYVGIPEEGGEFGYGGLNKDDPYVLVPVKPGLTVFVDAATWHGVKPVLSGARVALVATTFPEPGNDV